MEYDVDFQSLTWAFGVWRGFLEFDVGLSEYDVDFRSLALAFGVGKIYIILQACDRPKMRKCEIGEVGQN